MYNQAVTKTELSESAEVDDGENVADELKREISQLKKENADIRQEVADLRALQKLPKNETPEVVEETIDLTEDDEDMFA